MTRSKVLSTLALIVTLAIAGAAQAEITFGGGDGQTAATAITIVGAAGESDGVQSEYDWIAANRPGAAVKGQALVQDGARFLDVITLVTNGKEEELFFDITAFFGKY
jgi:hypothetical protein